MWHTLDVDQVIQQLNSDPRRGLTEEEARRRLAQYGPNRLVEEQEESLFKEILHELTEPMILLLLIVGVLYAIWGGLADTITIFAVILTLVGVEVATELRADRSVEALHELAAPTAHGVREGDLRDLPTEELVPGDVVSLNVGERVPADLRLLEVYGLTLDEAALTGESAPVTKQATPLTDPAAPLAEQTNMAFAGTLVTRGRGRGVVVATGPATEFGQVARLAGEVKEPRTPLQRQMKELSESLVWIAVAFSVVVPLLGVLVAHQDWRQMVLTGLTLAFATIPEELPIIITMVLALGASALSRRKALVKRLRAAETLGSVTTICADKTGTLTENAMSLACLCADNQSRPFAPPDVDPLSRRVLQVAAHSHEATLTREDGRLVARGDPMEVALLEAADRAGLPVSDEGLLTLFSFDNERRLMSAVYREAGGNLHAYVKGAVEAVLQRSTRVLRDGQETPLDEAGRAAILSAAGQHAADGLRVIALAERMLPEGDVTQGEVERELLFVGLAGLEDLPRPEVPAAVAECQGAGIRVMMITGDHPNTARAVARQVGLNGEAGLLTGAELDRLSDAGLEEAVAHTTIFARTTPAHKLRLVQALQARGEIVAVTGDGVNDAPALKAAEIGVAMGETGSDVAREAADMVLADDNFATIAAAVREGRKLFDNLHKGVRYYLACKVALIAASLLGVLAGLAVPFAPVQIVVMELFMDLAASATFVAEPAEPDLMRRKPRPPKQPFMDRSMLTGIFAGAAGLFAAVAAAYLITWSRTGSLPTAQTMAFVTWLLGHALLALNMRSERAPLFRVGMFTNRLMWVWIAAVSVAAAAFVGLPFMREALKVTALSSGQWALAVGLALVGSFWQELVKVARFAGASTGR